MFCSNWWHLPWLCMCWCACTTSHQHMGGISASVQASGREVSKDKQWIDKDLKWDRIHVKTYSPVLNIKGKSHMFLFYHFVMLVVKTVKATNCHTNVFGHLKQLLSKRSKNMWFEHLNKYRVYTHKIVLALYNQHCSRRSYVDII